MKVKPAYRTYRTQWKETVFILQEFQKRKRKRTENTFKPYTNGWRLPKHGKREGDLKIQENKGILERLNWKVVYWHILQLNCQESKKRTFKTNKRKQYKGAPKDADFSTNFSGQKRMGWHIQNIERKKLNQKYYWWSCSSEAFRNKNWGNSSPLDMLYKKC